MKMISSSFSPFRGRLGGVGYRISKGVLSFYNNLSNYFAFKTFVTRFFVSNVFLLLGSRSKEPFVKKFRYVTSFRIIFNFFIKLCAILDGLFLLSIELVSKV